MTIEETRKALNYAIKIYKCVNNVHEVVGAYKKLVGLYDNQKLESKQLV